MYIIKSLAANSKRIHFPSPVRSAPINRDLRHGSLTYAPPAAHVISLKERAKKKMLKYAKRTQFIGLSTGTTGYTIFPPRKRVKYNVLYAIRTYFG